MNVVQDILEIEKKIVFYNELTTSLTPPDLCRSRNEFIPLFFLCYYFNY